MSWVHRIAIGLLVLATAWAILLIPEPAPPSMPRASGRPFVWDAPYWELVAIAREARDD